MILLFKIEVDFMCYCCNRKSDGKNWM